MIVWAAIITFILGLIAYISADLASALVGMAEFSGVVVMFTLVCAAEAFS